MEILGVGPLELIFIFLIALILLGPTGMGKAGTSVLKWIKDFTQSDIWNFLRDMSHLPTDLMREANLEEAAKELSLNAGAPKKKPGAWKSSSKFHPTHQADPSTAADVTYTIAPPLSQTVEPGQPVNVTSPAVQKKTRKPAAARTAQSGKTSKTGAASKPSPKRSETNTKKPKRGNKGDA